MMKSTKNYLSSHLTAGYTELINAKLH